MIRWPTAPNPLPQLGGAHVWAVALDEAAFEMESWSARLSPDEQERADKFKFERDRRRYLVAHTALRDILARYTRADPASLQFITGAHGKPKLAPPLADSIDFNLSHSHDRALVAVNDRREIGVDIEFVKTDFEFFEIAKHFFTEREVAALATLPESLQRQAFYKCWTSKEAFLKAKGSGLSGQLDEVEIALDREQVRIEAAVAGWALKDLDFGDGYEAALVTQDQPAQVSCYRWQPVIARPR
jgi:4'-phosphopantetheinyl transferase